MSYRFYLGGVSLPVAPGRLEIKRGNKVGKIDLVSGEEAVVGQGEAVAEIAFSALLPQSKYPFAEYSDGFKKGCEILAELTELKEKRTPFRFIVTRNGGMKSTNIKVVFSQLTVKEDAEDGFDIRADVKLTEYRDYAVKRVISPSGGEKALSRPTDDAPEAKSHKVVKGDCLWMVAQTYLGDGNRYKEIYELNKALIDSGNKGTGNPVYTIYPGQTFVLP